MTKKLLIIKIITNIFQKGKPKANTLWTKPIPLKHFLSIDIHIFPVLRKQDIVNWPANLFFSSKVYKNKSVWNRKCTLFPIFQKPHKIGINTKSFLFLTSSLYTNPALQIPPKKKKKTEEVSRFKIKKITLRKKILKVARVKFNAKLFPISNIYATMITLPMQHKLNIHKSIKKVFKIWSDFSSLKSTQRYRIMISKKKFKIMQQIITAPHHCRFSH